MSFDIGRSPQMATSIIGFSVGFTGTRRGMSERQKEKLTAYLRQLCPRYFHYGGALGADAEALRIVRQLFSSAQCSVVLHPSNLHDQQSFVAGEADVTMPELHPLQRNRKIVDACELLFAAPYETHEVMRSGTWSTVRYARKRLKNVVLIHRGEEPSEWTLPTKKEK